MATKEWEKDLEDSVTDFERVVGPVLEDWSDANNIAVESVTDSEMAEKLDTVAGVDSWQVRSDDMVRGVGSRVQYMDGLCFDTPPDTFTVRKERQSGVKTEFEKRLNAIRNDGLYPYWTTQAYLTEREGELESLARVKTKELILHIESGQDGEEYQVVEPKGQASFYVVRWSTLEELGIGVRYKKPYQKRTQSGWEASQAGLGKFMTNGDDQ